MALERLQKILAAAGVCSRREAEEHIVEGLVRVNGHVITELGAKADIEKDIIKYGGKVLRPDANKLYIILHKPKGCVSTLEDPQKRQTVVDLLRGLNQRVYPVGRLDYESEGLLILTNDGEFANAITHPSKEVPKTYEVKVKGIMSEEKLAVMANGVRLKDGVTAPARVRKIKLTDENSWIKVTIHEGKNRQVRRMCDALGNPVMKLKRTKIGPLSLTGIPLGMYREMTPAEVKSLLKTAGMLDKKPAAAKPKPKTAEARPMPTKSRTADMKPARIITAKPGTDRPRMERDKKSKPKTELAKSDKVKAAPVKSMVKKTGVWA